MMKYLFVICFAFIFKAFATDIHPTGPSTTGDIQGKFQVLSLTQDNFDSFIEKHEAMMVKFHAPWCGHCKKLAPEYEKAAEILQHDVLLADLDATQYGDIAQKYEVTGYPTIKFFMKNKVIDYDGGRTTKDIVDWVTKRLGPAVKIVKTATEIPALSNNVQFIGRVKSEDSAVYQMFYNIADINRDLGEFYALVGGSEESITAKRKDEADATLNKDLTEDNMTKFINDNSFPLFGPIGAENFNRYLERGLDFIWVCMDESDYKKLGTVIRSAADSVRGQASVVWLDTNVYSAHAQGSLDVHEYPAVVYTRPEGRYVKSGKTLTKEELTAFFEDVKNGKAKRSIKSQAIPEKNDEDVKVVVGNSFDDLVVNTDKNVLLEVYAPWCGHCKRLQPTYDNLASQVKHIKNLVIAKIDGNSNEATDSRFQWTGFPTIFYVSGKSGQREITKYTGDRTLDDFHSFLKTQLKGEYTPGPASAPAVAPPTDSNRDEL